METVAPSLARRAPAHQALARRVGAVADHLRLAWPVFVVFLAQRLLTIAFVYSEVGSLLQLATRWDAGWYLRLAEGGYVYPNLKDDGSIGASNLAYFPLFPWLVRQVADVGVLTPSQALVVVSWCGGLLAVWAIFAVGNALYGRWAGVALATLWGMAPASLTLTMGYPEGWFTAFAAAAILCLHRHRPIWAGVCALFAGLLRPSATAVVAMVALYAAVELWRWLRRRRRAGTDGSTGDTAGRSPGHALLGAVVATLGLGAFMIYVGIRTGETFGYFTVQEQWGQEGGGPLDYLLAIQGALFGPSSNVVSALNIAVCVGYLLLFCLIVFDRRLVWASVYAGGILLISFSHLTFQHVYARQLLPAFVVLIPLIRMRVPRLGAIAALALGSVVMSWGSAQLLIHPESAM